MARFGELDIFSPFRRDFVVLSKGVRLAVRFQESIKSDPFLGGSNDANV